jgi:ABC-2 type transport system ATP-binding protein
MNILSIQSVSKNYHNHKAVDNVSFDVPEGSIFGLLGPNGAGKTSLIRIITTITGADSGKIILDGQPIDETTPAKIGYMPEERGLYKKMKVAEQLLYLAQLKGLSKKEATEEIKYWFNKFDIADWWNKKIDELSKGMQQKIQFIATVIHRPKLLILDEPFSGLDPVNTNLIKDEIHKLNDDGTTIIFSTHRMEQVEEICERIVLINKGSIILEGGVEEVKQRFKENLFKIESNHEIPTIHESAAFRIIKKNANEVIFKVSQGHDPNELLSSLIQQGIQIRSYNEILPSLNDIFIKQVS